MRENYLKLRGLPLFKDLNAKEIDKFISGVGASVKYYEKGERILKAYKRNSQIGIITEGQVQIISEDRFGHETINHALDFGAMLGGTSAILPEVGNRASIETLTETAVLWIPYHALLTAGPGLGHVHGIVMRNFLKALCYKNVFMMQKIELLSQKSLRERVIVYLLQREKHQIIEGSRQNGAVYVPRRVQMAKELECNRSALTREISAMQADGLLVCGDGWMQLNKNNI